MKKIFTTVLCALMMLCACAVCVSADEAESETEIKPQTWEIPNVGMTIHLPGKWIESGRYFTYERTLYGALSFLFLNPGK